MRFSQLLLIVIIINRWFSTNLIFQFLDAITNIENLSLEGNQIFTIEKPKSTMIYLKSINLSKNKLTMITGNQFDLFENM